MRKISQKHAERFDVGGFRGYLYVDKKETAAFNVLLIECMNRHFKMRLTGAQRTYFVLEGIGTFIVNGKRVDVHPDDLVLIDDGDVFEYEGQMKLFEFNIPSTDESNEEKLE